MLWIELSLRYGIPENELKQRMSSREFVRMMAYRQLVVDEDQRNDIRFADLMTLISGIVAGKNKKFSPHDFIRNWRMSDQEEKTEVNVEQIADNIRLMGAAYGAIDITRK